MDTKFQTSFIPKKPLTVESATRIHSPSVNFFTLFAAIVFIVSLAGAGFVFTWKNVLLKQQAGYQSTLTSNENEFNPTLIQTLQRANMKIDFAKNLLATHLAPDAIFNIIGQLTAQNVSFTSLDYTAPTDSNNYISLTMNGIGTSFSAIAFQSDVFGQSIQYGENVALKNPVLSGLGLNTNGNVTFTFTTQLDPTNIEYSKILQASLGGADQSSTGQSNVSSATTTQ